MQQQKPMQPKQMHIAAAAADATKADAAEQMQRTREYKADSAESNAIAAATDATTKQMQPKQMQ
jgi:hypothetical protein